MKYIIGAYASAPSVSSNDEISESSFYDLLKEDIENIKGLEIPFYGNQIHQLGDDYLIDKLEPTWSNVITAVPASFNFLKQNIHFGLASDHEESRLHAIDCHLKLNSIVHKINDKKGKKAISSIQICTSPSVPKDDVSSSEESFKKSLEELLSWNWDGSNLLIEHCDSQKGSNDYQKGFFQIEQEIELLDEFNNKNLGITLNWGRSVLEGRSVEQIVKHINLSQQNKHLKGFIFSGTSSDDPYYGSWLDLHMPFYDKLKSDNRYINSLLTEENVLSSLQALDFDGIDYLGIKLQPLPQELISIQERIEVNNQAISTLENLSSGLSKRK
jgi:hypothetical protein